MSYFAVVLSRVEDKWFAQEIDLDDVGDFDGLVEEATAQTADGHDLALIAVEENDEWLALVRVDGEADTDARVFMTDTRVLATSQIAALFADALDVEIDDAGDAAEGQDADAVDDDEETSGGTIDAEPGGDAALVADLGTSAAQLLALCAKEGALPGDVTAAICERAGCLDVYDSVRGT